VPLSGGPPAAIIGARGARRVGAEVPAQLLGADRSDRSPQKTHSAPRARLGPRALCRRPRPGSLLDSRPLAAAWSVTPWFIIKSRVDAAATATRTSCCEEPRRHMRASPISSTEPLQCVVDESKKGYWHVDARQEWDLVLRDSGLVKTVHVDTSDSENLSDIFTHSVRLHSLFLQAMMHFQPIPTGTAPECAPSLAVVCGSTPAAAHRRRAARSHGAAVLERGLRILRPSEYRSAVTSKLS
jgi:hypothetical protein